MRTIKTTTISILALGLLSGSVVGVSAQDEGAEPTTTSFTGSFTSQADIFSDGTTTTLVDQLDHVDDVAFAGSMVSSDPRLTGTTLYTGDWLIDQARSGMDGVTMLKSAIWELTNPDGSWIGESRGFGDVDAGVNVETIVFIGRGGYEGLTAVLLIDATTDTYKGTIFPAAMPEVPELYATE